MKELVIDFLNKPIRFDSHILLNIICENKSKYVEIMNTLENDFINTNRGFKIYQDGQLLYEESRYLYIKDSFSLSLNSKKNLNALYKILKSRYYLVFKEDFSEINEKLEEIIKEISIDFDVNLVANAEIKIDDIFKISSLEFSEDYNNFFEKLIKFIKISNGIEKVEVLFIKNMHAYLSEEEIISLIKEFSYLDIMIINIEFFEYFKISNVEKNYIIDKDLCEIY